MTPGDSLTAMGQKVDPFDLIEYHLSNVRRLWNGEPVRDLAESEAGYLAAMQHLRGAVHLIEQARYCVTAALNCSAHPWHGSDEARKWLIEAARLGGLS